MDKELDQMLSIGWVVHPIDDGVWGVFSSSHKIETRFEKLQKIYPGATISISKNCCKGDYIIKLYGE